ncbi:MAG TPA: phosphohistidine phosphatase SixA [Terriglobia bacterium]|nr:phosphohistidine phosphatase SixA [Terriglobia bacterium]
MEIYVLRHGIAVNRGTPGYKKDSDRPLTPEGEEKLHQIAKAMLAMELKFDLILSSPYLRSKQTAQLVAAELDEEITLTDLLTPDGNPLELIRELNDEKPQSVLLVGHEPYLSGLISVLVTGESKASIELKKGGLCKLSADRVAFGQCATLNWLLTPKQMRLMV